MGGRWRTRARTLRSPPPAGTHRFAAPATQFVGRREDLRALESALASGARCVTVRGAAGVGKTRLAVHYATTRAARRFPGGVEFCDLSEATTVVDVCAAVSEVLSVPLDQLATEQDRLARVGHVLDARGELLVVLDNLEQVAAPARAAVVEWLRLAPRATLLATSREALDLAEERVADLAPFAVPDTDVVDVDDIAGLDAVRLFVDRAARARGSFRLTRDNAGAVAALVRRLEGIALAIELGAAQLDVLSPDELLARLEHSLDLAPVDDGGDARHRTLRAAIDESWVSLSDAERVALAQCSVFRGGFDVGAVEAVLELPDNVSPLEALRGLRARSLLLEYEPDPVSERLRWRLYDTVRAYAQDQLAADPAGAEQAGARHAAHYARVGGRWADAVHGADWAAALDYLARERDNLLAAARWFVAHSGPGGGDSVDAVLAAEPILRTRGPIEVLAELLDGVLHEALSPHQRARALVARGCAREQQGRLDEAGVDFEAALEVALQAVQASIEVDALRGLGRVAIARGELDRAAVLLERARGRARGTGNTRGRGSAALELFGVKWEAFRLDDARALAIEALEAARELGDSELEGRALLYLGIVAEESGHGEAFLDYVAQALALFRARGNRRTEGIALVNLGIFCADRAEHEQARAHYRGALQAFREVGDRCLEGRVLGYRGLLEQDARGPAHGHELLASAVAVLAQTGPVWNEALFRAGLAASLAARGHIERSHEAFAVIAQRLEDVKHTSIRLAVSLYRGHLELARARDARARGDEAGAARHIASAREAVAAADAPSPDTGASPADTHNEVAVALRVLRAALGDRADAMEPSPAPAPGGAVAPAGALLVGDGSAWFRAPGGARVELSRRRPLRLILAALVSARARRQALPASTLIERGWPDEAMSPEAALNRLYVAIGTLRKLGLRELLLHTGEGYLLDPDVPLAQARSAETYEVSP